MSTSLVIPPADPLTHLGPGAHSAPHTHLEADPESTASGDGAPPVERPSTPQRHATTPQRRPPFYPNHWRLLGLLCALTLVYVSVMYAPLLWEDARMRHEEAARLKATLLDEEAVAARRARVDAAAEPAGGTQPGSAGVLAPLSRAEPFDPLSLLSLAAEASGATLTEVRPGEERRVRGLSVRVAALRAEGDFFALLRFTAALEAGAPDLTIEQLSLEGASLRGENQRLELTARVLISTDEANSIGVANRVDAAGSVHATGSTHAASSLRSLSSSPVRSRQTARPTTN